VKELLGDKKNFAVNASLCWHRVFKQRNHFLHVETKLSERNIPLNTQNFVNSLPLLFIHTKGSFGIGLILLDSSCFNASLSAEAATADSSL
jgi:hypothetical protein